MVQKISSKFSRKKVQICREEKPNKKHKKVFILNCRICSLIVFHVAERANFFDYLKNVSLQLKNFKTIFKLFSVENFNCVKKG